MTNPVTPGAASPAPAKPRHSDAAASPLVACRSRASPLVWVSYITVDDVEARVKRADALARWIAEGVAHARSLPAK